MYKLIMLLNPILVGDEKIKDNDFMYRFKDGVVKVVPDFFWDFKEPYKKVIAGLPELPQLDLSLVDVGYVDVEKLADKANGYGVYGKGGDKYNAFNEGFKAGFNAKKHTEEDMVEFLEWVSKNGYPCIDASKKGLWVLNPLDPKDYTVKELLDSWLKERQPKVYNVEVEMEARYNRLDFDDDDMPTSINPKITNNTIKVTKIL